MQYFDLEVRIMECKQCAWSKWNNELQLYYCLVNHFNVYRSELCKYQSDVDEIPHEIEIDLCKE